MEFRLLGPLAITDDSGRTITVNRKKHRQLLAALLIRANTAVPRDQLVSALWGDRPPRSARGNLKTYVSQLRRGIDRIETGGDGYLIRVGEHESDSLSFEALLRRGLRPGPGGREETARLLEAALGLWRGDALQDAPLDGDMGLTRTLLDEQRLTCLERLMHVRLAQGRHPEVLTRLHPVLAANPLHERLWSLHMTALYRDGRCAEALAAYRTVRSHLAEELGVDPSPELQGLHGRILSRDPALSRAQGPSAAGSDPVALRPSDVPAS